LNWSNAVYVGGAVLTFAAAAHVLYEKRAVILGRRKRESVLSEASVITAAAVSLIGTLFAIRFGNVVSHLKDNDLAAYKTSADLKIAQANSAVASANRRAQEAYQKGQEAERRAAQANAHAAETNLALEKIKAPRSLSGEQRQRMKQKLAAFAGTKYDLFVTTEPESTGLLDVIDAILTSAGWEHVSAETAIVYAQKAGLVSASGIVITVSPQDISQFHGAVEALANAIHAEGIACKASVTLDSTQKSGRIHVVVGTKPMA
jgi:hypothetical protein